MNRSLSQAAAQRFRAVSLKNKIFFSIIAVILIISAVIALMARWILVDNLLQELELRGIAIARTIAERSSGFILDKNHPELLSLIFDEAKLKERQHLVAYIFVSDREDQVLSHTLTRRFPESLRLANQVPPDQAKSVRLCLIGDQMAYDIATPITQGIYRIGTVHVGLNKSHIDQLVAKLRTTFLGFLSAVDRDHLRHHPPPGPIHHPAGVQAHPDCRGAEQGQLRREIGSRAGVQVRAAARMSVLCQP